MSCCKTSEEDCASEESPYKAFSVENVVYNVNTSVDEDKDFKTPKRINIKTKPSLRAPKNAAKKAKSSKRSKLSAGQMRLTTFVKENSQNLNVDPDQWQLALTLSKSIQEQSAKDVPLSPYPSTQEKLATLKQNLERFGFNSNSRGLEVQRPRPVEKKKKKSKFQYINPVLLMRTQEDRDRLISEKVSHVLSQNVTIDCMYYSTSGQPFSEELKKYWSKENNIYQLHGWELESLNTKNLYTKSLNLEPNKIICGALLKDWSQIPGREASPIKEQTLIDLTKLTDDDDSRSGAEVKKSPLNEFKEHDIATSSSNPTCVSPDLFSSDDEVANQAFLNVVSCVRKLTADLNTPQEDSNSQSLLDLSPKKKSATPSARKSLSKSFSFPNEIIVEHDNGSCSYESFRHDDPANVDCVDLTLSSEDERGGNEIPSEEDLPCFVQVVSKERDESRDKLLEPPEVLSKIGSPAKLSPEIYSNNDSLSKFRLSKRFSSFSDPVSPRSRTIRRSKSLNITNYINEMLNEPDLDGNTSKPLSKHSSFSSSASDDFPSSQKSILISDEELNYSCKFSSSVRVAEGLSEEMELANIPHDLPDIVGTPTTQLYSSNYSNFDELPPTITNLPNTSVSAKSRKSLFKDEIIDIAHTSDEEPPTMQPKTSLSDDAEEIGSENSCKTSDGTPSSTLIVKTVNVTPTIDYDQFNTPKINKELDKFGLKPMKRQRGAQLLKYIYETTHPYLAASCKDQEKESGSDVGENQISKKRKLNRMSPSSRILSSTNSDFNAAEGALPEIVENLLSDCKELFFERKQSKKISSCLLPLHIAWHNLISTNLNLKRNILLYEPIHLEVVYSMLKDEGYHYHIEDLLTFLDKKCVTVRTNQGQNRQLVKKKKSPKKQRKATGN